MRFVLVFAAALAALVSCSLSTDGGEAGTLPDARSFIDNGVSTFMERRCGSLDCHGQEGRPLRIYSDWGLRLAARDDGTRDASATTAAEQLQNYYAVAGLEPENLSRCFTNGSYDTFQLMLKPLGVEGRGIRHKGGPVLRATENDPGWQCLYGWASNKIDKAQCDRAKAVP